MLITERRGVQIQLLIEARRGAFEAPSREINDWMTLKSWYDQLTDPDSGIFAEAVTTPDYVYGPLAPQEVVLLDPRKGEVLRHPLGGGEWQGPLFR